MAGRQSPYDLGTRLEPKPWVNASTGIAGSEYQRPAEPDDWGRVDFDNDEGASELNIYAEPDGQGGVIIHVTTMGGQPVTVDVDGVATETFNNG